jgi:hypothetical protein
VKPEKKIRPGRYKGVVFIFMRPTSKSKRPDPAKSLGAVADAPDILRSEIEDLSLFLEEERVLLRHAELEEGRANELLQAVQADEQAVIENSHAISLDSCRRYKASESTTTEYISELEDALNLQVFEKTMCKQLISDMIAQKDGIELVSLNETLLATQSLQSNTLAELNVLASKLVNVFKQQLDSLNSP